MVDMTESLMFLGVMAFMAGLIDAAVGGGGLIQIPAFVQRAAWRGTGGGIWHQ